MTVTPYRANLFHDRKELYQLLSTGKQRSIEKKCPQIVSISQEIDFLDPLAVLQAIAKPDRLHFYFEKRSKNESIVGIDAVTSITIEGENRFPKSQQFIGKCLANTLTTGNLYLPYSGPHFFCSFTFFEDKQTSESPFPSATVFLPRWQISCCDNQCILVANILVSAQVNLELIVESLCNKVKLINYFKRTIIKLPENYYNNFIIKEPKNSEWFKSSVLSALKSIQAEKFSKIVLANAIDIVSSLPFNSICSLDNLRKRHPDCYVFSTSNGKGQTFMGASPERLISIHNQQLLTDALAGSAPRGKTASEDTDLADQLIRSDKERREHQFVLGFIEERLSQLGLMPQRLPTPQLLKLSNIQHLWTPIQAQVPADVHPFEILAKLHPTPAVAGLPRDIALQHILHYEQFDRCLYAAPLGWVDYQGKSEFIVGIRSALIEGSQARLYAGAGIVAGSDPDKELIEIHLKFQPLLRALV